MTDEAEFEELRETWKRLAGRVAGQSWPEACLYVVATPIGNLGDLGLRAWQALLRCDAIAAEDTRSSRALLDAWGVRTPLMAAHRHNENQAAEAIVQRLARGERVALISDAGAPAVSDPGARIVRRVREAGYRVMPIPGPSAVIAALMASGATTDEAPGYAFAGFAPAKAAARRKWLQAWGRLDVPVVLFESPHRLRASVADLAAACGSERRLTFARELSKRFEQIHTVPLGQACAWLDEDPHRGQGEFVLILHPDETPAADPEAVLAPEHVRLMEALLEDLSVRDAARIGARATGLPRETLYAWALRR
ncbi:16S rRNA (cytidine(1402)-2'-O)-methyltransferase [Castellaniella sp. S9]|uniref:16S rRNA (cytidine(1402)-2'-O)-methyltransferase n=1 Tax=Castellaniella sp. S9 TaxID=2993652 RepID=UPI0022B54C58|nr:16S rRNA (cytidine(1402)-2'-O)-methyltransferase [Castellaniella sp. S9]